MLKLMRDRLSSLKWILWFVVFVFVLLVFVDWGSGRGSSRGMAGVAAQIGDVSISEAAFLHEMKSTEARFRDMYGQQYDQIRDKLDLGSITIQNLVDRELLLQIARSMGLHVTDQELLDRILSFDVFRRQDGTFVGPELYARILRSNQTTPEEFEASLRQDLLLMKLNQAVTTGLVVPDEAVEREYERRNEKASFAALFVPVGRAEAGVQVSDDQARAYYDAHKDEFERPDQRRLRYLLVDNTRLRRTLDITDAQIQEYYQSHQDEFKQGEEVKARHILIRPESQDDAGWQAALTKAQEVYRKATAPGADFAALAREYSDDTGSKEKGGDLGWFGKGRMVPAFEKAAFSLEPGQVSEPVRSQFGYHIIEVEDHRPARLQPLSEVREQVRQKIADGMIDAEGSRRAASLRETIDAKSLTTGEQWQALADENDVVTSNVTPYFAKGEPIPGLGRDPELAAAVWDAKKGAIGGPTRTNRGWVVYEVEDVRSAGLAPFDEVEEEARDAARRETALTTLTARMQEAADTGLSLDDLAARFGGAVQDVTDHRRGAPIAGIGSAVSLEKAVFATAEGSLTPAVQVGDRGVAVARVTAKTMVDPQTMAAQLDDLRSMMVQDEAQKVLTAMLAEQKREHPVTINQELVSRFGPRQG